MAVQPRPPTAGGDRTQAPGRSAPEANRKGTWNRKDRGTEPYAIPWSAPEAQNSARQDRTPAALSPGAPLARGPNTRTEDTMQSSGYRQVSSEVGIDEPSAICAKSTAATNACPDGGRAQAFRL